VNNKAAIRAVFFSCSKEANLKTNTTVNEENNKGRNLTEKGSIPNNLIQ
jgi:hypothetical protein